MGSSVVSRSRSVSLGLIVVLLLTGMLAGCGPTSAPTAAPAESAVPATSTSAPSPAVTEASAAEPTEASPAASEAATQPASASTAAAFAPLDATDCKQLAEGMGQVLGVTPKTSEAAFTDYISGESGTGCQASAKGTGADFGELPDVAAKLQKMLEEKGWKQDSQYQADGPTGTAMGFKKDPGLCLLSVNWEPSADADCPDDQPISACDLKPEQKEFTIELNCAQPASK